MLEAVLAAARDHDVVANRVSQGSGAMLLTEAELRELTALGSAAGVEVSLFVGPREGFGVGAHPRSPDGAAHFSQLGSDGASVTESGSKPAVRSAEQMIRQPVSSSIYAQGGSHVRT